MSKGGMNETCQNDAEDAELPVVIKIMMQCTVLFFQIIQLEPLKVET